MFEKLRGELTETSDGVLFQTRKPFERGSFEVFDEEESVASVSFAFLEFAPSHRDLERLQMRLRVGGAIVDGNFDLPRI